MAVTVSASIEAERVPTMAVSTTGSRSRPLKGKDMKLFVIAFSLLAFAGVATAQSHHVKGYTKKDGTYVAPHEASNPNAYRYDNRSSQTNGGTKRDEYSATPARNKSNPAWGSADNDADGTLNAQDSTPESNDN
jgi:hypothetical protein